SSRTLRARATQRPVHLRPAVANAVDLVLAGNMNDSLVPGLLRIDLGVEDGLLFALAVGQQFAIAVDEPAMADEAEAAFFADAVDGDVVDVIFQSAGVADVLHRA